MKTLNYKSLIRISFSVVLYTAFALMIAVANVGCGGDDGGNNRRNNYFPGGNFPGGNCVSCVPTNIIHSALGSDLNGNSAEITFYAAYGYGNYNGGSPYTGGGTYMGPVEAQGYLNIVNGSGSGFCQIPPGQYMVQSIGAGQMDWSGLIYGMQLEAYNNYTNNGYGHLQLEIEYASFVDLTPAVQGMMGQLINKTMLSSWDVYSNGYWCTTLGFVN